MTLVSSSAMARFKIELYGPDAEKLKEGGPGLMKACEAEAEAFSQYLQTCGDPVFQRGLVKWEASAIAGFLYQKTRGHIDAIDKKSDVPDEDRTHGET